MDKLAYEFGVKVAMVDVGLMEKQALNPFVRNALLGAGAGAAGGGALAAEGRGLEGALAGAGMGAGAGLLGTAGAKGLKGLRKAMKEKSIVNAAKRVTDKAPSGAKTKVESADDFFRLGDPSVAAAKKKVRALREASLTNPPML